MRRVLRDLGLPGHAGLAYDVWARVQLEEKECGKIGNEERSDWLGKICKSAVDPDYAHGFARWRSSFDSGEGQCQEVETCHRLLVGHGNPSGTDVGLSFHHTWGVPIIPGSALKGIVADYVAAEFGGVEPKRSLWRGPGMNSGVAVEPPGEHYRGLFGAPEIAARGGIESRDGARGYVEFHDALFVPGKDSLPLARDVMTVHQKPYYDSCGANAPPTDYHDPNPVSFLTVSKEARFLLALSGPQDWTNLAMRLLLEALASRGVGGKTSSGYGRLLAVKEKVVSEAQSGVGEKSPRPPKPLLDPELQEFRAWLDDQESDGVHAKVIFPQIQDQWFERLSLLSAEQREIAGKWIRKAIKHRRFKNAARELTTRLEAQ